jgi:hypothetical protein
VIAAGSLDRAARRVAHQARRMALTFA